MSPKFSSVVLVQVTDHDGRGGGEDGGSRNVVHERKWTIASS